MFGKTVALVCAGTLGGLCGPWLSVSLACSLALEVGESRPASGEGADLGEVPAGGLAYFEATDLPERPTAELRWEGGVKAAAVEPIGNSFQRGVFAVDISELSVGQRFELAVELPSTQTTKVFQMRVGVALRATPGPPLLDGVGVIESKVPDTCFDAGFRVSPRFRLSPGAPIAAVVFNEVLEGGTLRSLATTLEGTSSPLWDSREDPAGKCFVVQAIDHMGRASASEPFCLSAPVPVPQPMDPMNPENPDDLVLDQGGCVCARPRSALSPWALLGLLALFGRLRKRA